MSREPVGNARHIRDPGPSAQPPGALGARPRVLISRCLLGDRVRYDGRDKHQPGLKALAAGWEIVPTCPEIEAGLGVPRPPMDLVGPPDDARPMERASGRDLTGLLSPVVAAHVARWGDRGLDGAVLKSRSPSCGLDSAARYAHIDAPAPAQRVDGVFAAGLRSLEPRPALIDEIELADPERRAAFALAVEMRHAVRAAGPARCAARWGPLWREVGLASERLIALLASGDRNALVEHIDTMAPLWSYRLIATDWSGVHQTNGSGLAEPDVDPGRRQQKADPR